MFSLKAWLILPWSLTLFPSPPCHKMFNEPTERYLNLHWVLQIAFTLQRIHLRSGLNMDSIPVWKWPKKSASSVDRYDADRIQMRFWVRTNSGLNPDIPVFDPFIWTGFWMICMDIPFALRGLRAAANSLEAHSLWPGFVLEINQVHV